MQEDIEKIDRIHKSGYKFVLSITGGGSGVLGDLLSVPGGSSSILEGIVPYSEQALCSWLHCQPDQYCSGETARRMAVRAFERAVELVASQTDPKHLVGVGCTASLVSSRPKKGAHRAFIAIQTYLKTSLFSFELEKGKRNRREEEQYVQSKILEAISEALFNQRSNSTHEDDNSIVKIQIIEKDLTWGKLFFGDGNENQVLCSIASSDERFAQRPTQPDESGHLLFPGSFHPIHRGHLAMIQIAQEWTDRPVELELSVHNVDKGSLDYLEIEERLSRIRQVAPETPIWLTRTARFIEKAICFPNSTFIIGIDTLIRLDDSRYDGGDANHRVVLTQLADLGARFLVFDREIPSGQRELSQLDISPQLRNLCEEIPWESFHDEISSTELRTEEQRKASF